MKKLYAYVVRFDYGAAPNPFGSVCTLSICKPAIRRRATKGSWIIGTGSKHIQLSDGHKHDFSKSLVYAMKVTDIMSLADYDKHCREHLKIKIPDWQSIQFEKKVGDCIYDYSGGNPPFQRSGVHRRSDIATDLKGKKALLSDHFYYFGSKPVPIPNELQSIIPATQNCKLITNEDMISMFEKWISEYQRNTIYAEPQLKYCLAM